MKVIVISIFFLYGVGVGVYKYPPFESLAYIKNYLHPEEWNLFKAVLTGRQRLLESGFTDPVIKDYLIFPAITKIKGIQSANERIYQDIKDYGSSYESLKILATEQLQTKGNLSILRLRYLYQDKEYNAYAYGELQHRICSINKESSKEPISLIIPGSGINQSYDIYTNNKNGYQYGILEALQFKNNNVFVLIKPNESSLAWHNGKGKKLNGNFIWNYHLNRKGSYSSSYLVNSLAFMKYFKSCSKNTIIAGLSQGGAAALLNSLQSKPTLAIIASGYSVTQDVFESSDHNQLIKIQDGEVLTNSDNMLEALSRSTTNYLFTWGRQEQGGVYRIEAEEQLTANKFGSLKNVTTLVHDAGHIYPVKEIQVFLKQYLFNL